MRITQQLQYALYGLFDLAYNGGTCPMRIQEISERQMIPNRYLEQIFQKLRRGGLVTSKRGPGGGYLLSRSPKEISIVDVLRAMQGEVLCRSDGPEPPANGRGDFVWRMLEQGIDEALQCRTIADLCLEAERVGMERAESEPAMYHI